MRIGLSATQRPLDEVARWLGGFSLETDESGADRFAPRSVEIVDAGLRKELDLEVTYHHPTQSSVRPGATWPAIEARLLEWIRAHRSTIIFANNRRVVERTAAAINDLAAAERTENADESASRQLARAHHGSVSLEERRSVEESLKTGELAAVVATASLELGIDMGSVDLVCQVESPGSVSRGLQRVGRAGHVVGRKSKGRIIAKTPPDLLESAALARAMLAGEVELLRVPTNCLDILAQQVIACAAVEPWDAGELLKLVRCAYPYRDLPPEAFESVLAMVSGRYPTPPVRDMQARVHWDRVENRLHALPGSARLALVGGGAITDTGAFPVYLGEGGPRLGELDEEFVFERRAGDTFALGTSTWRIESIDVDRVLVSRSEGAMALPPFWRGEQGGRSYELGLATGALSRKLSAIEDDREALALLAREYPLDRSARENLLAFHRRQKRHAGIVPDDRNVLVETFLDPAGELGLAVLSVLGGRLNQAIRLLIQARLRQRLGVLVSCLHSSDGVLVRIPKMDEPPLDILDGIDGDPAVDLIRRELCDSALFGLRFRQNAGRALLMPRPDPGKRAPLWLQRLRAKDLLQIAGKFSDYPVVVETYRECLAEDLDIARLKEFLDAIASGTIKVNKREGQIPSPYTSAMIFQFQAQYMYEWDEPRRGEPKGRGAAIDTDRLDHLLSADNPADTALDPRALATVEGRLRGISRPPRTADELAQRLVEIGDAAELEIGPEAARFAIELESQGRAARLKLPGSSDPDRWIAAEYRDLYKRGFNEPADPQALAEIVRRYPAHQGFGGPRHAFVALSDSGGVRERAAREMVRRGTSGQDRLRRWKGLGDSREPARGRGASRWRSGGARRSR